MKTSEAIRIRLQHLEDEHGRLTASIVVEDARSPTSPLHSEFDWDVERAALRHWIERAREIIRSVHVVVETTKTEIRVPFYLRDPEMPTNKQGYVSLDHLRTDDDLAREALRYELTRAIGYMQRAEDVAAVLDLEKEVRKIISAIKSVNATA